MAVNRSVVSAGVLVTVGGAGRADVENGTVQIRRAIWRRCLDDVMGQRHRETFSDQRERLLPLRWRDEVGSAQLVIRAPAAPVGNLLHGAMEVFCRGDSLPTGALRRHFHRRQGDNRNAQQEPGEDAYSLHGLTSSLTQAVIPLVMDCWIRLIAPMVCSSWTGASVRRTAPSWKSRASNCARAGNRGLRRGGRAPRR